MFSHRDLISYLESPERSFRQGLMLYNVFKHTKQYDRYFSEVADPATHDDHFILLIEQLQYIEQKLSLNPNLTPKVENITAGLPEISLHVIPAKKKEVRISEDLKIDVNLLPVELFSQYQQSKENWNMMKALHAEMRVLPQDSEFNDKRRTILNEINVLEQKNREIWMNIEKWEQSKNAPAVEITSKETLKASITRLRRKIHVTKEYLKKKNLRKATFDKYTAQLQLLQDELDKLLTSKSSEPAL